MGKGKRGRCRQKHIFGVESWKIVGFQVFDMNNLVEKLVSIKSWEDLFKYGGHFFTFLFISTAFTGTTAEAAGNILRNMTMFYLFFWGARSMSDEDLSEKDTFQYLKEDSWVIPVVVISFILGFFLL